MLKNFTLPGFNRIPVYEVGKFFVTGIRNGAVRQRAASVAYTSFLSIFPGIVFLFTLIPYIPIRNFQDSLLTLLSNFIPDNTYRIVETTVVDIVRNQRGSLLSLTFISTLFFASSGVVALMRAFNATYHSMEKRKWWKRRLIAILMLIIEVVLSTAAVGILTINKTIYDTIVSEREFLYHLFLFVRIIVALGLFFFSISFLYYFAPTKKERFRFISAGSTLATVLIIAATYGFRFFVNRFGQFNKIYGSLGTIVIILIWIYIVSFGLIIGFELNASIMARKYRGESLDDPPDE